MPWTAKDARSHTKKADTPKKKHQWAKVANAALKEYGGDEGRAVRVANAAVKKSSAKGKGRGKKGKKGKKRSKR
jgi:uncharacterized protein YdaT